MTDTGLQRLAAWVAGLRTSDVPDDVRQAARLQVLDHVAAAHAAGRTGEMRKIASAMDAIGGTGNATVLWSGVQRGPIEAAYENAASSMAHDFDDIVWMGHTGHSAVFASLAIAEHLGRSVDETLVAVVAANEVAGRLGASCFLGPLNGQMWTFIHTIGAAAAGSKLLGLDAAATANAFAIALSQPPFALQPAFFGVGSKVLSAAEPTATGMRAAFLAAAGVDGAVGILEDRRGFWRRFSFAPLPRMLEDLGTVWVLRTLQCKSWPTCHYFQTTFAALSQILARSGPLDVEDVSAIEVDVDKLAIEVRRFASEYIGEGAATPTAVSFDLPTALGVFLTHGQLVVDDVSVEALAEHQAAIQAWRNRVVMRHDPMLTAKVMRSARAIPAGREALRALGLKDGIQLWWRYRREYASNLLPARDLLGAAQAAWRNRGTKEAEVSLAGPIPLLFPARVTIVKVDGTRETAEVDMCPGSIASPGHGDVLREKWLREAGPVLGDRAQDAWDGTFVATGAAAAWVASMAAGTAKKATTAKKKAAAKVQRVAEA